MLATSLTQIALCAHHVPCSVHAAVLLCSMHRAVSGAAEMLLGTMLLNAKYASTFLLPVADERIDVVRKPRVKENKQARDKHVLGLLTSLRAVFPSNVTESIGRQILPYAKYDVVPDELQLKQPIEKNMQYTKNKIQYDKKMKPSRKYQAPFQRR